MACLLAWEDLYTFYVYEVIQLLANKETNSVKIQVKCLSSKLNGFRPKRTVIIAVVKVSGVENENNKP